MPCLGQGLGFYFKVRGGCQVALVMGGALIAAVKAAGCRV